MKNITIVTSGRVCECVYRALNKGSGGEFLSNTHLIFYLKKEMEIF
jgi:hypothetical protein